MLVSYLQQHDAKMQPLIAEASDSDSLRAACASVRCSWQGLRRAATADQTNWRPRILRILVRAILVLFVVVLLIAICVVYIVVHISTLLSTSQAYYLDLDLPTRYRFLK